MLLLVVLRRSSVIKGLHIFRRSLTAMSHLSPYGNCRCYLETCKTKRKETKRRKCHRHKQVYVRALEVQGDSSCSVTNGFIKRGLPKVIPPPPWVAPHLMEGFWLPPLLFSGSLLFVSTPPPFFDCTSHPPFDG